jgi:hypothetical protein
VEGLSRIILKLVEEGKIEGVLVANGIKITHLLFVDDVLFFGNTSLTEWKVLKETLDLFCNATGMSFSSQKSLFLEAGWTWEELTVLKDILPYEVKSIEVGFKYLGFFIKPNCYTLADWSWLQKKMEKRISNWSHRWLTLGGRFTLVKSVLESIHVYWISLAKIPKSILNKIRRNDVQFFMDGEKRKRKYTSGKLEKNCQTKEERRMGFKKHFGLEKHC